MGAAAQQLGLDAGGMGPAFLAQFYPAISANRPALAGLYHPAKSQFTLDTGAPLVGRDAIMAKILGGAPGADGAAAPGIPKCQYSVITADSAGVLDAPLNGVASAVLVLVTGHVLLEGESNPLAFGQVFLLAVEGGATYVANDVRCCALLPGVCLCRVFFSRRYPICCNTSLALPNEQIYMLNYS